MNRLSKLTRRGFLLDSGMVAAAWELSRNAALAQELKPTLSCRDGDEPTLRQGEGHFSSRNHRNVVTYASQVLKRVLLRCPALC